MSRKLFLVISGVIALLFGTMVLLSPASMLEMSGAASSPVTNLLMVLIGANVVLLGLANIIACSDPGSPGLRALMLINILLHLTNIAVDAYGGSVGTYKFTGLIGGFVIHAALAVAFLYYFFRLQKSPA